MVKLALSGLDGVEETRVILGAALVVYAPEDTAPEKFLAAIHADTPFQAKLKQDGEFDQAAFDAKERKCGWFGTAC